MKSCEDEPSESTTKPTAEGEATQKNQSILHHVLKENQEIKEVNVNNDQPNDTEMPDSRGTVTSPEPSVSSSESTQTKCEIMKVNSLELPLVKQQSGVVLECPITNQPLATIEVTRAETAEEKPPMPTGKGQPVGKRPIVGPPPSYSFVMKQKRKGLKPSIHSEIIERPPPPPTYSGLCVSRENEGLGRICIMPSYSEPRWRSHPQPAICPRCGILVFTTTHTHDSLATHMAALALCLFGCWPCCFLPYCIGACKNTYHHCPFCQSFLGSYTPW